MKPNRERLTSLDVLRGLAVAGMIVVTSPGDWNNTYPPLLHADWAGWTPTDLIFPTFLFAVGMALGLSFPRDVSAPGSRGRLWAVILRRVVLLIGLGLALELVYTLFRTLGAPGPGPGDLAHLRIPGVLQRIGLCYGLAATAILLTALKPRDRLISVNARALVVVLVVILVGYALAMLMTPVPGHGAGQLDPEGNLAAWIDRSVFTPNHLWSLGSTEWAGPVVYDPEGLLSTLPATANVLAGVLTVWLWTRDPQKAVLRIAVCAGCLIGLGLLLDPVFPINKRIWTSSFALLSSGFSGLAFVVITLLLRTRILSRLSWPLKVLGANAILAFVMSQLFGFVRDYPFIAQKGALVGFQAWANSLAVSLVHDAKLASLTVALATLATLVLLLWPLHRKGWHLRL